MAGEFDAEQGVGVLDRLGDALDVLVDYGLAGLPVETAHCAQEAGHCPLVVASAVGLQEGLAFLKKASALGTVTSAGSSRVSVCTTSGRSSASWRTTGPLLEWPATCTRRTPRWSSRPPARGVVCDAHRREGGRFRPIPAGGI